MTKNQFSADTYIREVTYEKLKALLAFALDEKGDLILSGPTWDIAIMPPNTSPMLSIKDSALRVDIVSYFDNTEQAITAGAKTDQLWSAIVRTKGEQNFSAKSDVRYDKPTTPMIEWC